jgi:hypothetical protein
MVALKPDFVQVGEPAILGDVFRRKMAVIVQNRLSSGVGVIKMSRGFALKKKVSGYKPHVPLVLMLPICRRDSI